jgi:2-haloacid dehalogenase
MAQPGERVTHARQQVGRAVTILHVGWMKHDVATADQNLMIAFDRARADIQNEKPAHLYPEVLRRCFDSIAKEFRVEIDAEEREKFAGSPHNWPAYPDSHVGLEALQARVKIGALSNIDNALLLSSCQKLNITFDLIVTAERVGAYKPDWPHFHTAIEELRSRRFARERILHVGQSLRADITPANKLGVKSVWINRPGRALGLSGEGAAEARPDLIVSSLAELVSTVSESERTGA